MTDYTLQPDPGTTSVFTDASLRTIGVEFYCDVNAWVTAIHYKRNTGTAAPASLGVWAIVGSTLMGSQTWTATTADSAWNTQTLTTPIAITAAVRYRAAILPTGSVMTGLNNYWISGGGSTGLVSGQLRMPPSTSTTTGVLQGCYNVGGTLTFPNTGNTSRANYGVGVTVTDVNPTPTRLPAPIIVQQAVMRAATY